MSSSELEELRQQLAALTGRVDGGESLRAMMDSDLADIKQRVDAQDHLLPALHITQSNHTQRLTRIEDTLGRMEPEFRGKLDMIIAMLARLTPPTGRLRSRPCDQPTAGAFVPGCHTGWPR
jgi:septal ring factor EnvC (AmiA/AmiB activator)